MPPNQKTSFEVLSTTLSSFPHIDVNVSPIRVAILGCGMMGQEHISYISGYNKDLRIDYLCDPHQPSLDTSLKVMVDFYKSGFHQPVLLHDEEDLLVHAGHIDLLVMAHPNYLHTPSLLKWAHYDITILVEKPVAVSQEQVNQLGLLQQSSSFQARIWVAMEYRYIPAISKLLEMRPKIGDIKTVTIRENRYPFLEKIGDWNRDPAKTGDTLVEKCCHFFDLFRLISGKEADLRHVRSLAQRGINYEHEPTYEGVDEPILDSAYVTLPFRNEGVSATIACLELCMFAEGSRHQEEIVVTGTKGRVEAYLPENKVYVFQRPNHTAWSDRTKPPPPTSIRSDIIDCSDLKDVFGLTEDAEIPTHGGYHYSSTSVEWYQLIAAMKDYQSNLNKVWAPHVSLDDGIRAVEIGITATESIVNGL